MSKDINARCPLQGECGRKKCDFVFKENECNYYIGNRMPGKEIAELEGEEPSLWDEVAEGNDEDATLNGLVYIPIDELYPHPDNVRKNLGDIEELSESIRLKGVLQNLTVVPGHRMTLEEWIAACKAEGVSKANATYSYDENAPYEQSGYTVIIGHRRLAAAKAAGLTSLPCVTAELNDEEQITTMMLENMQRSDLTVYEQAKGFQLMIDYGNSVEEIASKSGFSSSTIRRRVKLLELDEDLFSKSVERGGSLNDYAELNKLNDVNARNRVLEKIGTPNFNATLKQALSEQEDALFLDAVERIVSSFAKKGDDFSNYRFSARYEAWYKNKEIEVPADKDTAVYAYARRSYEIVVYKECDENFDKERERAERERQERLEASAKKLQELRRATERAYELRREYVKCISDSFAKRHLEDILSYLTIELFYGERISAPAFSDMLGIVDENGDCDQEDAVREISSCFKDKPYQKLLRIACVVSGDDERNGYILSYKIEHIENDELDRLYEFLGKLGYELSDEELQLKNGTHVLLKKEEWEK